MNDPQETPEQRDQRVEDVTVQKIVQWLTSLQTGAYYGSNSWNLRKQLSSAIERGEWKEITGSI